ncbi:hypothetical protein FSP39_014643 [Pinctada imbricata]|uniref:Tetraspanin n=1 Tax=Pinctada imbricata TaxID=66713 RepID=A0AA88YK79_PINIB|nr:hypothetical protein FSP39_014643 [Pinctada imbricata]
MVHSACGRFLKYSMFFFNSIMLIAGCGLLGFGVWSRTNQVGLVRVSSVLGSDIVTTMSLILIIAGGIVILISFLGCCGAIKEVRCMLVTFFLILILIFIGFIVCGILGYIYRNKIEEFTLTSLKKTLTSSYGSNDDVTEGWDSMQQMFRCCGVSGNVNSTDSWAFYKSQTDWFSRQKSQIQYIPDSCCTDASSTPNRTKCVGLKNKKKAPVKGPPVTPKIFNDQMFTQGCYTALGGLLENNIKILSGVIIGVAAVMILGMVFAVCLCKRIEDDEYCEEDYHSPYGEPSPPYSP